MSERLYFIFGLPPFNRTEKQKANGQLTSKQLNSRREIIHSIWEWLGYIFAISIRSLCLSKSWQDTERVEFHSDVSPISARCRKSCRKLDEIWETNKFHGEITEISPWHLLVSPTSRWGLYKSRRDLSNLREMEDISPRSRRDLECHERHGVIQSRRDLISARSRQSRWVLGNLGEMEDISPRSRRDLKSNKHHGEISARSHQSRRDLGKTFARVDMLLSLRCS